MLVKYTPSWGAFFNYVDKSLAFFDIFYLIKVDKKSIFLNCLTYPLPFVNLVKECLLPYPEMVFKFKIRIVRNLKKIKLENFLMTFLEKALEGIGIRYPLCISLSRINIRLSKGKLISKCPYEKPVLSKIPTKNFPRFLP